MDQTSAAEYCGGHTAALETKHGVLELRHLKDLAKKHSKFIGYEYVLCFSDEEVVEADVVNGKIQSRSSKYGGLLKIPEQ